MLEVRDLHVGYEKTEIVHGVDFTVDDGEFVCVLGANGCGKTTTLKAILGLLKPFSGDVLMDGSSTLHMPEAERAKLFAYIPQAHTPPFPFTVADVVLLGRTPYINRLAHVSDEDVQASYAALQTMGIVDLADIPYTQLSGGQQQLVLISRALAQEPRLLIMDEPTASLDFGNQQLVLSQMRHLVHGGMGVLMVTHDPDHALYCASRVVVMEDGRIIDEGAPNDILDADCLRRIYHTEVKMVDVDLGEDDLQRVCVPVLKD